MAEVIEHGENGFLVEYGEVADLTERLDTILADPALGDRMGTRNSIQSEQDFGWQAIARRTIASYEAVAQTDRATD